MGMPDPGEPGHAQLRHADAEYVCAQPWPNRASAELQARWLSQAGWHIDLATPPVPGEHPRRPDGARTLASVYHPETRDSLGDITYRDI